MFVGPPIPQLLQYMKRDTAILLKLNSDLVTSGAVMSCLVELVSEANGLKVTSLQNITINDHGGHYLFIEGLVPNQEYRLKLAAVNEAGVSGFTEWTNFTTTSTGK